MDQKAKIGQHYYVIKKLRLADIIMDQKAKIGQHLIMDQKAKIRRHFIM